MSQNIEHLILFSAYSHTQFSDLPILQHVAASKTSLSSAAKDFQKVIKENAPDKRRGQRK